MHLRIKGLKKAIEEDVNVSRFIDLSNTNLPKIPRATGKYLAAKVPIIQWIPKYSLPWLWNDLVAGITIGILLVPQSLAYAKVANIPARYGLISSWLPTLFYMIMGTSKDVMAGPTAIMGLLTGEIVTDLVQEGYSAQAVASAVAFWVGIYSLLLGLLRLGFLLDFIPLPVLSGYVSAAAITIVLKQLKALFGESKSGSSTAEMIREFFVELPTTNWRGFLIGMTGIALLLGLQFVGRRWGKKCQALWYVAIARNALALILFTLISWGVNKNHREDPLFGISKVTGAGIIPPKKPNTELLIKIAGRSVAPFVAAALEHLAIGKAFARRYGYVIEQDQELGYIGVVNLFGSFFSCMPITGGFSRTAVNAESGVKTPLSGLATTACVLMSIYKLQDAFYWIPSATLSALVITAVWQIILPFSVFWHYWKISFAGWIGSMVTFWVTLFASVEVGIASAVAYSLVYVLLRIAFARVTVVTAENFSKLYPSALSKSNMSGVPDDAMLFMLQDSILFLNADRIARQITNAIYTYSSGALEVASETYTTQQNAKKKSDRLWNDTKSKHVRTLRKEAGTENTEESPLPSLRSVVIDMTRVTHVDATGMQALADIRSTLKEWAGPKTELKFTGLNQRVKSRFKRSNDYFQSLKNSPHSPRDEGHIVFDVLQTALYDSQILDEDVHKKQ